MDSSEMVRTEWRCRPSGCVDWSGWHRGEAPVMIPPGLETEERSLYSETDALRDRVAELESVYGDLQSALEGMTAQRDVLRGQLDDSEAGFKNFHRMLSERFGYTHDETDWRRDQVSLMEHVARKLASLPDRRWVRMPESGEWRDFERTDFAALGLGFWSHLVRTGQLQTRVGPTPPEETSRD